MSLVNAITVADILTRDYGTLSRAFGGVVVTLFLTLFAARELLRAADDPRSWTGERVINAFLVPLSLVFVLIIAARFIRLLLP